MSCPCVDCVKAKCLITPVICADDGYEPEVQNLIIGAMDQPDTDYTIYFDDQNNGVVIKVNITSDAEGMLAFNMNDYPRFFHPNTAYKSWVTLMGAEISQVEDITFGPYDIVTCLVLEFKHTYSDMDTLAGKENQEVML